MSSVANVTQKSSKPRSLSEALKALAEFPQYRGTELTKGVVLSYGRILRPKIAGHAIDWEATVDRVAAECTFWPRASEIADRLVYAKTSRGPNPQCDLCQGTGWLEKEAGKGVVHCECRQLEQR